MLVAAVLCTLLPTVAELTDAWARWRPFVHAHATYALDFTDDELERVARGGIAKRRERLDGADRVLGVTWTFASRDQLWVAIQDDQHWNVVAGLNEEQLPGTTPQHKLLFQHLALPWPLSARQWVLGIVNNRALWDATESRVWERTWSPSPVRGASAESPDAVWVDVNDGGWLLADAAGGTLLAYHVRSVVGGNVPDEVATQWAHATLGGMLREIVRRAEEVTTHYDASHAPIQRPDGSAIPPFAP